MGALQRQERLSLTASRFGGCDIRHSFDDVWAYHSDTGTWTEISTTGITPQARSNHAAALVDGIMYISGGRNAERELLDDLAIFDIKSSHWLTHFNTGNGPSPRGSHNMIVASADLIVFGSNVDNLVWTLDMVWTLDTAKTDYLEEDSTSLRSTLAPPAADNQNHSLPAEESLALLLPDPQLDIDPCEAGIMRQHQDIGLDLVRDSFRDSRFSIATEISRVRDVSCNKGPSKV